jgi:hypothetical protein
MPRKFRLGVHRKNAETLKASKPVIEQLVLSLPRIECYELATANSLATLKLRIGTTQILPEGCLNINDITLLLLVFSLSLLIVLQIGKMCQPPTQTFHLLT